MYGDITPDTWGLNPGHMGNERVTAQNLTVMEADKDRNLLLLKGAIPGPPRGLVMVKKKHS